MAFFSKQEIIARMIEKRAELGSGARADMNLALLILGSALFEKRLKSGRDYGEHPVIVGMGYTRSNTKRIIGILHDVLEDSDWTPDDLRKVGFSERVVLAVDAMTHRDGERYFDSIERCSKNKDALDKKIDDLSHNMDSSRVSIFLDAKSTERTNKYMVARAYLVAVKKGHIAAGSSIVAYALQSPDFNRQTDTQALLEKFSSHPSKQGFKPGI